MGIRRIRQIVNLGVFVLLFWLPATIQADAPIQITGGLSPYGKLAIVVKRDEDTSQGSVSSNNEHPLLQVVTSGKIVGPLEEVDTTGGGFGHVLANLTAYWSPDSNFVAIRFRAGRLSKDFVVYRIAHYEGGYRATPQKLPDATTGPNGARIFAKASHAANMGDIFQQWLSPTEFAIQKYRFFPPYPPPSTDVDFFNGDGVIEVEYAYRSPSWTVSEFKKPPEAVTN